MKKLVFLILIVAVGAAVYATRDSKPRLEFQKPDNSQGLRPDPSNATFIFDEGPVTLKNGAGEIQLDRSTNLEINILDKFAYGDINKDGANDTVLLISQYGGGSGTFIYVAAFASGPVSYRGSNAVFLGDRIIPQNISIKNSVITVEYLDREPDESFAAEPTISTAKQFVSRDGVIEER